MTDLERIIWRVRDWGGDHSVDQGESGLLDELVRAVPNFEPDLAPVQRFAEAIVAGRVGGLP